MKLAHLGTTSKNGGCPELYASDQGSFLVQGTAVSEPGLPEGTAVVEIPQALFAIAAFAVGTRGRDRIRDTGRGTYIVRGYTVTDPEALGVVRARGLPDHEAVVEIPAAVLESVE